MNTKKVYEVKHPLFPSGHVEKPEKNLIFISPWLVPIFLVIIFFCP
jgi:hypothetical protein